jgi:hypothetical protein
MSDILITALFAYLCFKTDSINALSQQSKPSGVDNTRKAFFRQVPIAIGAAIQISTLDFGDFTTSSRIRHTHSCSCPSCIIADRFSNGDTHFSKVAFAYERRDVGGDTPSSDMAAMNRQAFETMNRLEKDGVKLEVSF